MEWVTDLHHDRPSDRGRLKWSESSTRPAEGVAATKALR
jgi:hypothetical protein